MNKLFKNWRNIKIYSNCNSPRCCFPVLLSPYHSWEIFHPFTSNFLKHSTVRSRRRITWTSTCITFFKKVLPWYKIHALEIHVYFLFRYIYNYIAYLFYSIIHNFFKCTCITRSCINLILSLVNTAHAILLVILVTVIERLNIF